MIKDDIMYTTNGPIPLEKNGRYMPQSITDIKFEHGHDANRLADSVAQLRDMAIENEQLILAMRNEREVMQSELDTLAEQVKLRNDEILARGKVIADQTAEIENHSVRAHEMKELLAALQHKYIAKSEELSRHLAIALQREQDQLAYVERMTTYQADAERRLRRLEHTTRYMNQLVAENTDLSMRINDKLIFRRLLTPITDRVRRIFHRAAEQKLIDSVSV